MAQCRFGSASFYFRECFLKKEDELFRKKITTVFFLLIRFFPGKTQIIVKGELS